MPTDLRLGDCLDILTTLDENSVDSIITDPPYGLGKEPDALAMLRAWMNEEQYKHNGGGFMGKEWDAFVPGPHYWREVLRVLKPGAMALVFGGTRTFYLTTLAMRIAGFEIRDTLCWLQGAGFPKSANISKMLDKAAGAEREVVGPDPQAARRNKQGSPLNPEWGWNSNGMGSGATCPITAPATDATALWDGWGTALKPAWEPIILAMKPMPGTFAQNALDWGVAGINVDGCRVATDWNTDPTRRGWQGGDATNSESIFGNAGTERVSHPHNGGRWPANLCLSCECALIDWCDCDE